MKFKLHSTYKPTGDQPEAIKQLVEGVLRNDKAQVLLGVTGSGKTFTMANVISQIQKPTLILSHNKTLAAQLYAEFKDFFPDNAVEYFVSYYDYYQPEAYLPVTDTYIEKDLSINDEIEKLRLSATSALLSGRSDVVVVSSVSCLYGIGNPEEFNKNIIHIKKGQLLSRNKLLHFLVDSLYARTEIDFTRGKFRVKGDTVDVFPAYLDFAYRIVFWGDEIEDIETLDPVNNSIINSYDSVTLYPANIFVTSPERIRVAINQIQDDMVKHVAYLKEIGKHIEAKRLQERVEYDLEMLREVGYCSGIENYSRYFDQRKPGSRPFCLLDFFPDDYLIFIDESHVTIPQIRAMYGGDRSRKENLVSYGFRLPAAMDNRPLKFDEFYKLINQIIYVSATPADFEIKDAEGVVVEQVIRPTGLLDPIIEVRPSLNQIDDLMHDIELVVKRNERVLVTTLTKRMAEELTKYLSKFDIRCQYIHSDVDTLERVKIMHDLRNGLFDVLIGVNLLREGLDLPEVSLVAILDADKEGFLRSERSLTQTAGRAARNINGKVVMYADKITQSMQKTIDETNRRRDKQLKHNEANNISPEQIVKKVSNTLGGKTNNYENDTNNLIAADPLVQYMCKEDLEQVILQTEKDMKKAAKELDFDNARKLRDELFALRKLLEKDR